MLRRVTYGIPQHSRPISVPSVGSGGLTLVGVSSIVLAGIIMILAIGAGMFVGALAMMVADNEVRTWSMGPNGAVLGTTAYRDPTATADEVEFMLAGLLDAEAVGEVEEQHLRTILRAQGRDAFPDAASREAVLASVTFSNTDGNGGVAYTLQSGGRFNVDAEGAEWFDPSGNRHFSGDVIDAADMPENMDVAWRIPADDRMLDAAVRRINGLLGEPLPASDEAAVRMHFADESTMPLGWHNEPSWINDEVLAAERLPDGALSVRLMQGTYTLPAGSDTATLVMDNGMPAGQAAASGGWLAVLGQLTVFAAAGLLLVAGIQAVRLKDSATLLHWLSVPALLLGAAITVLGSAIFAAGWSDGGVGIGMTIAAATVAVPALYALVLLPLLLVGPLKRTRFA
ncbi:MAG: hypothetical protein AAF656_01135 [Planctomycetota bacterium]